MKKNQLSAGQLSTLSLTFACLGAPSIAGAQSANSDSDVETLSEIVVTTTRRAESTQSVPVSISALSAADLQASGANQTRDLASLTPNLAEQGSFGRTAPSFFIRGIGSTNFNPNANSKVGIYLDDEYLNSPAVQGSQLFDAERVEVARGPQGTLFGQNTTAGLIRAISNKPRIGGGLTADAALTAGSYNQLDPSLAIGFETGATSAARISVLDQNRDGTQYNRLLGTRDGRTDIVGWRAQWLWKPTDTVDALLSLHGSRDNSDLAPYKLLGLINPADGSRCDNPKLGGPCTDLLGYTDTPNFHEGAWDIRHQYTRVQALGGAATIDWNTPLATITSVTAFERNTSRIYEDTDASPNDVVRGSYYGRPRQISEEIRITSNPGKLNWIVGGFYFHENLDSSVGFAVPGLGPSLFTGNSGVPEGFAQVSAMRTNSYSLFGNLDYEVSTRLKLSGGLRVTRETKDVTYDAFIDDVSNIPSGEFMTGALIRSSALAQTIDFGADKTWNDVSGRVSASYTLAAKTMAYVTVSRGYNSGNYNGGAFFSQAEASLVNPERLTAYEVGFKSDPTEHLRLNLAMFYYDFKDQQEFILAAGTNQAPVQQLSNAAASKLYGAELDAAWKPFHGLLFQLGGGYTHSRFENFVTLGEDLSGKTLPSAPTANVNGMVQYEWITPIGSWRAEADAKFNSKQFFSVNNDPLLAQGAYTLTNARLGWSSKDGTIGIFAWVKNLTNRNYLAAAYDVSGFGYDQWVVGDPRTFGGTVEIHFQ